MATSGDTAVLNKFNEMSLLTRSDILDKNYVWIPDSNGSSYNGQLSFDLNALGQTNRWLNYGEAYIQVPYVVSAKASTDLTAFFDVNSIGLKDGFHQLVDTISVEFNQKTVVQVQNFTNLHTQFKMLTSTSAESLLKNSSTNGFYGDTVNTYTYKADASSTGIGYCNNNNGQFINRKKDLNFDVEAENTNNPSIVVDDVIKKAGRSYYKVSGSAENRYYHWVYMATIKLADISDIFDKVPICKTTDVRIVINYNSFEAVIDKTAAPVLSIDSYQQISGHSCPVMLEPVTGSTAAKITIRGNVMRSGIGNEPEVYPNQCRLYIPIYDISGSRSLAMIQSHPTTTFDYMDLYTYVVPDITANQTFNYTLTTGIMNPQYIVVIPFVKTNTLVKSATYQSVFDSAPGTTSAVRIGEFNVQMAGINVFQQNQRYDYEQFIAELSKINAIGGNNFIGLTSGVLSQIQYQKAYRMYVCDCSRREPSQDRVTQSIVISGVNTHPATIEIIAFVAYKKQISIKTSTGEVLD
jgi:3D (Asp-Asp-Asp) domain-containing protein